jgi:hypothetical protein
MAGAAHHRVTPVQADAEAEKKNKIAQLQKASADQKQKLGAMLQEKAPKLERALGQPAGGSFMQMLEVGSLSKEYYKIRRARDDEYATKETEVRESEKKEQRQGLDIQAKQSQISITEGECRQLETKLRDQAPAPAPPAALSLARARRMPPTPRPVRACRARRTPWPTSTLSKSCAPLRRSSSGSATTTARGRRWQRS